RRTGQDDAQLLRIDTGLDEVGGTHGTPGAAARQRQLCAVQLLDVVELDHRLVRRHDRVTVEDLADTLVEPHQRRRRPARHERDQGQAPASFQVLHRRRRGELTVQLNVTHLSYNSSL